MKLVFLDVDGVLNTCEYNDISKSFTIHTDKINKLNKLLLETDSYIVLSSSWRYFVHNGSMNLHGLEWLFRTHGLANGRLIDITPPDKENETRGETITRWIKNHRSDKYIHIESYCIIDDMPIDNFEQHKSRFVKTNPSIGLDDVDCQVVKNVLNQPYNCDIRVRTKV